MLGTEGVVPMAGTGELSTFHEEGVCKMLLLITCQGLFLKT